MFNSDLIVNDITYFVVLVEHVGRPLPPPPPPTYTYADSVTDRQTDNHYTTPAPHFCFEHSVL